MDINVGSNSDVWVKAEHKTLRWVNASVMDELYIHYKGNGNYAIVGVKDTRDIHLMTCASEKEAVDWLGELIEKL